MAEVEKTDLADTKNDLSLSNVESTGYDLKGMIYVVRNQQVMIDSDLLCYISLVYLQIIRCKSGSLW